MPPPGPHPHRSHHGHPWTRIGPPLYYETPLVYAGGFQPYAAPIVIDCNRVRECLQPTPIYERQTAVLPERIGVTGTESAGVPTLALIGAAAGAIGFRRNRIVGAAIGTVVGLLISRLPMMGEL